jgi:hypothetical protein
LFFIIGGQWLISKLWHLVPISGFGDGLDAWRFVLLPVSIGVLAGAGSSIRFYRTLFLEEISKDYVRTARAKGLTEGRVLFRHVLHNGLIPVLTGVVVAIPTLFIGSLVYESFFHPALAAIPSTRFKRRIFVVRAMVFLGAKFLYRRSDPDRASLYTAPTHGSSAMLFQPVHSLDRSPGVPAGGGDHLQRGTSAAEHRAPWRRTRSRYGMCSLVVPAFSWQSVSRLR